ncbi:uncharacterized protein LOC117146595 isoform X1 [Drosophila mauritiana]|uniref:Uncharacterized protein LOC117146595 isoform X1 n=1 Tax=Drosophila mauritiana TaxID=7226 RepID=A0A6P8KYA8_DROMA|nr:uncharacterized protein LOC117146595 isoform X1 [Drosophila mauritiana]
MLKINETTEIKRLCLATEHSHIAANAMLLTKIDELNSRVLSQSAEIENLTRAVKTLTEFVKQSMKTTKPKAKGNPDDDFPILCEKDLVEVDHKISQDSRGIYTNSIRKFLRQGRLSRTIRLIFSEDILLNYNIDGNQKKKRLKDHEHLFRSLMNAIGQVEPTLPSEKVLSKAMRCVKNCAAKKKGKVDEDPLSFLNVDMNGVQKS